jgi:hypothetical protein
VCILNLSGKTGGELLARPSDLLNELVSVADFVKDYPQVFDLVGKS